VEAEPLHRAGQTEPIVSIDGSDEAPPSIAESSEQTLALLTAPFSSLPDLGEGGPAIVDISKFTTVTIVDKLSSPSGVEYKCEFEPLWLAVDSVEKAQMGRVHIRSYENGLCTSSTPQDIEGGKLSRGERSGYEISGKAKIFTNVSVLSG
jgi:hypothetical protein